jgi:flagellar biosynthesis protein FlhA
MDGASKYVRGDAVAGILVTVINVVGGLLVGLIQHDMLFADAIKNYTLLAIGDGLVAQIPSLMISTRPVSWCRAWPASRTSARS